MEGTLEQSKILGASYVQRIIDSLNNGFLNLPLFVIVRHYPVDEHDKGQLTKIWLAKIVSHFQWD